VSTILKALRRLEEEKAAAEQGRPLREQIADPPRAREEARRGWLPAVLALVIGVGSGGGLIWWLFGGAATTPDVVATAPVAAPQPEAAPPAVARPVAPPAPPSDAFASDVQVVERPDPVPRLADGEPLQPAPLDKPGQRRPIESSSAVQRARALAEARQASLAAEQEMRAAAAARARAPSPPQPAPAPEIQEPEEVAVVPRPAPRAEAPPAPAPAPVAAAKPAVRSEPAPAPKPAPVTAAAEPAPAAKSKPTAPVQPQTGPEIQVERTRWHPLSDRRVAWLRVEGESEPREVVEGQVVAGMLVVEIQPSGVVFERDGNRVRRALGGG
jgi:hypothetical protein